MCVIFWRILIQGKYPLADYFIRFVESGDCEETHIAKDQWNMVLEFLIDVREDFSNFTEDDAWPLFLLDFVDWVKAGCKKVEKEDEVMF